MLADRLEREPFVDGDFQRPWGIDHSDPIALGHMQSVHPEDRLLERPDRHGSHHQGMASFRFAIGTCRKLTRWPPSVGDLKIRKRQWLDRHRFGPVPKPCGSLQISTVPALACTQIAYVFHRSFFPDGRMPVPLVWVSESPSSFRPACASSKSRSRTSGWLAARLVVSPMSCPR